MSKVPDRAALVLAAALALLLPCLNLFGTTGRAQESAGAGGRGTAATAAADDGGEAADGAAPAGESRSGVRGNNSMWGWAVRASGPIGLVIAAMSFYLIALVVWMALRYRGSVAMPGPLVRELHELLDQKKYSDAYHRLANDDSLFARILIAGVRKLPGGLPLAQRAMEMANENATMEMEHRTTYLATVGTIGPMIGLVGTVYGMIMAFRVIALEGSSPQANQLAAGISTALFATLEGIAISIPAIFFYSLFRNRIARLSLEVAIGAEPLLEKFAPGVRHRTPAPHRPRRGRPRFRCPCPWEAPRRTPTRSPSVRPWRPRRPPRARAPPCRRHPPIRPDSAGTFDNPLQDQGQTFNYRQRPTLPLPFSPVS